MQKEKIAAIALGLIVVGALSGYILANNWEYLSENLFGPEASLKANDDIVSFNINSVNNNVKILDNDEFDEDGDISIEIVDDPSYGDIEVNGTSISYTPNTDYEGEDSFSYNLKDKSGSSSKATVIIEVTFGVNFAIIGRFVTAFTCRHTRSAICGSLLKLVPCSTLGHEKLSS